MTREKARMPIFLSMKMRVSAVIAMAMLVFQVFALPSPQVTDTCREDMATATVPTPSSSTVSTLTWPTAPYTVTVVRPDHLEIHLLPWVASGQRIYINTNTSSYCPAQVNPSGSCPLGNITAFSGLGAMDVEVPGGQLVYIALQGYLGFTQAHSAYYPPGAVLAPFTYNKPSNQPRQENFGVLNTNAFNAPGFMACPMNDTSIFQIFAAIANASVPSGNSDSCVGFEAFTQDYYLDPAFAAWQYI